MNRSEDIISKLKDVKMFESNEGYSHSYKTGQDKYGAHDVHVYKTNSKYGTEEHHIHMSSKNPIQVSSITNHYPTKSGTSTKEIPFEHHDHTLRNIGFAYHNHKSVQGSTKINKAPIHNILPEAHAAGYSHVDTRQLGSGSMKKHIYTHSNGSELHVVTSTNPMTHKENVFSADVLHHPDSSKNAHHGDGTSLIRHLNSLKS